LKVVEKRPFYFGGTMAKAKTVAKIVYVTNKEYTITFSIGGDEVLDKEALKQTLAKKELELRNNYGKKLKSLEVIYAEGVENV